MCPLTPSLLQEYVEHALFCTKLQSVFSNWISEKTKDTCHQHGIILTKLQLHHNSIIQTTINIFHTPLMMHINFFEITARGHYA